MRQFKHVCMEIVRLVRPYLISEDRLAAWLLLLAILTLTMVSVGLGLLISFSQRLFYTALQEKQADAFLRALFWLTPRSGRVAVPPFILLVTANIAAICLSLYLQAVLQLRWQRWLTARTVDRWLSDKAYYRLTLHESFSGDAVGDASGDGRDNPDQRIQEDIEDATRNVIVFATGLLQSIASIVSFGGLLYTLSGPCRIAGVPVPGSLLWAALLYAAVCTGIAHLAGRSVTRINFVRQRFRGDFRFALVCVRENAEEIAFLRGETAEAAAIKASFARYYRTALRLVLRTSGLSFLSSLSDELAIVFPTVIAAPRFFAGQISFGTLNQIRLGFLQLAEAALWFVSTYAQLAEFVSQLERLSTFQTALAHVASPDGARVRPSNEDRVRVDIGRVASATGDTLLGPVAFDIPAGSSTAITGTSGAGKTTLLRLLSGLRTGTVGHVTVPDEGMVFVPQRAYLPAGALRRALCYPIDAALFADAELGRILSLVGLDHLAASLDITDDWSRRLSPGQQQRLALGRAILQQPSWLFLDEPTASLHGEARVELQHALATALPLATLVTVTHDPAVAALHDRRIELAPPIVA